MAAREAIPSTGGENLGLTTEETEIVWGSDGGAADIETFFFLVVSVEGSSGLFLFLAANSAMAEERMSVVFYHSIFVTSVAECFRC